LYIYLTSLSISLFVAIFVPFFCSCSKHQNVVRQRWYDIFHYVYMYLDFFLAKHHTFITCEYILFFFLFSPIPVSWSSFVINLYWCVFLCLGWNSNRQTCFARNDDQRPCAAYVWFVVILSSFLFFCSCALHAHYSFFLYVDCSSYFMYNIRDILNKRKELIITRQISKWDYYYYYLM